MKRPLPSPVHGLDPAPLPQPGRLGAHPRRRRPAGSAARPAGGRRASGRRRTGGRSTGRRTSRRWPAGSPLERRKQWARSSDDSTGIRRGLSDSGRGERLPDAPAQGTHGERWAWGWGARGARSAGGRGGGAARPGGARQGPRDPVTAAPQLASPRNERKKKKTPKGAAPGRAAPGGQGLRRPSSARPGPARRGDAPDMARSPSARGPRGLTRDVEEAQPLGLQSRTRGQRLPVLLHGGPSAASAPASDFRRAPTYICARGVASPAWPITAHLCERGGAEPGDWLDFGEQSVLLGGLSLAASPTSRGTNRLFAFVGKQAARSCCRCDRLG